MMHRSLGKTPKKRFVRFPRRAPAVRKRASPEPRKGTKTRMPGCGAGTGAARERGMGLTLVRDAPLALAGCVNLLEYRPARDAGGMVGGVSHARLAPLGVKLPRPPRQSHDSWRLTTRQLSRKKNRDAGAARARAPVVGAGEDGVMNEVVHRREGLRLDISFCGSDTGRDGSAVRRKGRGRGGQETLVEKTREDGRMSTPPPGCDAISSPGDARYGRPELTSVSKYSHDPRVKIARLDEATGRDATRVACRRKARYGTFSSVWSSHLCSASLLR